MPGAVWSSAGGGGAGGGGCAHVLGTVSSTVAVLFWVLLGESFAAGCDGGPAEGRTALPGRRARTAGEELEE